MIEAPLLIELALKSAVISGAALVALHLVRFRSAAERSFVAHSGLLASLLLPLAMVYLPAVTFDAPLAAPFERGTSTLTENQFRSTITDRPFSAVIDPSDTSPAVAERFLDPSVVLNVTYGLPAVVLTIGTLIAVLRLLTLRANASVLVETPWLSALAHAQRRMGFKDGTALLVSDDVTSPVSWGLVRPVILLNRGALTATREAEAIIAHELAHVARLDWAKMLIARLVVALYWFNPLVWRLAGEAHQLREEAADDAVLRSEVNGADYASLLVGAARHENRALLLAAHGVAPRRDSLKRRVARVLDAGLSRVPARRGWAVGCSVVTLGVVMPLAAATPVLDSADRNEVISTAALAFAADGSRIAVSQRGTAIATVSSSAAQIETSDGRRIAVDDIIEMKALGVTPDYVRALGEVDSRYRQLSTEELISFKALGVTPEFLQELKRLGFETPDVDDIEAAAAHRIDGEFVRLIAQAGFENLTLEELVEMRIAGVTPAYIEALALIGYRDLEADDVVEAGIHGVDPAFARDMANAGFENLTLEELVEMRIAGVTADYIQQFRDAGYRNLTPDEVTEMSRHGVDLRDLEALPPDRP